MAAFGVRYRIRNLRRPLSSLALYGVVTLILGAVAAVTVGWGLSSDNWETYANGEEIRFSFAEESSTNWSPEQAYARLGGERTSVKSFATNRSERPFWLEKGLKQREPGHKRGRYVEGVATETRGEECEG